MSKDWIGNKKSTYSTLGASNHSDHERESNDFYATPDEATYKLLSVENFSPKVWENACGVGSISKVLEDGGYEVFNTDLVNRGYSKQDDTLDFLKGKLPQEKYDIITNPPYRYAQQFIERGYEYLKEGGKMAMLLKLTFLEGQGRRVMFERIPPARIHVFSKRITCAMNAKFDEYQESGAVAYAWYVWEKGYKGLPQVDWI